VFDDLDNINGNGDGFKLGGDNVRGDHTVNRNRAFENIGYFSDRRSCNVKGYDFNNNPGAMTLLHITAFNKERIIICLLPNTYIPY